MEILLISPYHGGSHRAWAEGYQQHSQHTVQLLTLPAHYWKWRLEGGAITLARLFLEAPKRPNFILATSMTNLPTFLALTRTHTHHIPTALYMHENQLTYPLPQDGRTGPMRRQLGERDLHYALINYTSMLAADAIFFNSAYHQNSWFAALPAMLKHFPEYNEMQNVELLQQKSQVLPVGIDFQRLTIEHSISNPQSPIPNLPPLILWNQRWEYDKNPEMFLRALYALHQEGIPFRAALCGQWFVKRPLYLDTAVEKLGARIIHLGYADETTYKNLLWQADVVVSTAYHEFFGISILEAIYCHTFPILPRRLSYPELLPEPYHLKCLYQNERGLLQRLRWALANVAEAREIGRVLGTAVSVYDWSSLKEQYDSLFTSLVNQKNNDESVDRE